VEARAAVWIDTGLLLVEERSADGGTRKKRAAEFGTG